MAKFNDVTVGQMEACINRLGGMQHFLEFIGGKGEVVWQTIATLYSVIVDYNQSLAEMISEGKYDWVGSDINLKNFPKTKSREEKVEAELLHFGRAISSKNALAEMSKLGFRPATLEELLSFGAQNTEVQREFSVVALGSLCVLLGVRRVPCLYGDGSLRFLNLFWFDGGWHGDCRFLVVRD